MYHIKRSGQAQQATHMYGPCSTDTTRPGLLAILCFEFSCAAVLQIIELEVGLNNITGTLPSSWNNLTQASTEPLSVYVH